LKLKLTLSFFLVLFAIGTGQAQYKDLFDFNGTNGAQCNGAITLSNNDSILYGMTLQGGSNGDGLIFSVHNDGTGYFELLDCHDNYGENPPGSLILSGNTLYGMANAGGATFQGIIFSLHTDSTGFTDLHDFNGTTGEWPNGSLILVGNTLYGLATSGGIGPGNGYGCVFSVDTSGLVYKDLYNFTGSDGNRPYGSLLFSNNVLYGTTFQGGANNDGVIFSINPDGSGYKDLFDFNGTNGKNPYCTLALSGNVLYGTTHTGGANNYGSIFSIHTDGSAFKDVFDFSFTNGANPYSSLTLAGNTLYGMTNLGGTDSLGTIFSILTDGTGFSTLYNFDGTSGSNPQGDLTFSKNGKTMYGMTYSGGAIGDGVIFSFDIITSGIPQLSATGNSFTVYPNPCKGNFVLETISTEKQFLTISDVNGKVVLGQIIEAPKTTLFTNNFAPGVYTIGMNGNQEIERKKLVIIR